MLFYLNFLRCGDNMSKEELFGLDYRQANKIVCRVFYFIIFLMLGICAAGNTGMLTIDPTVINFATAFSCAFLVVPGLIVNVLNINKRWVKYFCITISVVITTEYFMLMGYNIPIMFVLPIIIALMYFNTKIVYVTAVLTVFSMTSSYFLGYYITFLNFNSYSNIADTMMYGAAPQIIQMACISVVAVILSMRTSSMLKKFVDYSSSIEKNKNILDKLISETQCMFSTRRIKELTKLITDTLYNIISVIQKDVERPSGVVAVKDENGSFYSMNERSEAEYTEARDGYILAKCNNISINFSEKKLDGDLPMKVTKDGIFMPFYENNLLIGYVIFEIKVNKDDVILTDILNILYNYIYLAIHNTKQNRDIFMNQEEIVCAFAEISESKSKQTGQHIKRVAEYMKILGEEAGYTEEQCMNLSIASMMHDVGKLIIPSDIIDKESGLTEEEYEIIKSHVKFGECLLRNSPGEIMQMARVIALQHHEKWDGTGYLGLKGEDIDYNSRLMALADVFDALVSKRSYKEGWAPTKAYNEIIEQSGTHFDPQTVEMFKKRYNDFLTVLHSYPDDEKEYCFPAVDF